MPEWLEWVWVLLALLFFAPVVLVWWLYRRRRRQVAEALFAEPLVTGGEPPVGPVQAEGACQAQDLLSAPLSGRRCVGYTLEVTMEVDEAAQNHDGPDAETWDLALIDELAPFTLELGHARAAVAGQPSYLGLVGDEPDERRTVKRGELPVELQNRLLAQSRERLGFVDRLDLVPGPDREVRVAERLLLPGQTVLVIGEARAGGGADGAGGSSIGPRSGMPLVVLDVRRAEIRRRLDSLAVSRLLKDELHRLLVEPD